MRWDKVVISRTTGDIVLVFGGVEVKLSFALLAR
jgi:hypothetical protein